MIKARIRAPDTIYIFFYIWNLDFKKRYCEGLNEMAAISSYIMLAPQLVDGNVWEGLGGLANLDISKVHSVPS